LDCRYGNTTKRYESRSLLYYYPTTEDSDEKLIIQYARRLFTGYQSLPRSIDVPPISEAQAEAIDALHFVADKYAITLDFEKGDIQYINNLSIFHAREAFTNSPTQQ
jgi:hypothetical protein